MGRYNPQTESTPWGWVLEECMEEGEDCFEEVIEVMESE